jgi:hypothetical protein
MQCKSRAEWRSEISKMINMKQLRNQQGVTFLETLFGIALFLIIAVAVYQSYLAILNSYQVAQIKLLSAQIANEEIELAHNMSFDQVGIIGGIPNGILASSTVVTRGNINFTVDRFIRNIDDPFDGTFGGSPNDTAPADYKLFQVEIRCTACLFQNTFTTTARIAPKNLESDSNNGALFIRAIDASGLPVEGVTVQIQNPYPVTPIDITDVTDSDGWLRVIDVPPATQAYQITVSKTGFSTDQTFGTTTVANPVTPHATVAAQTITQATFAIDQVGELQITSTDEFCNPIGAIDFDLRGTKLISAAPDVYKYDENHFTDASGNTTLSNIEWDTYVLTPIDETYNLIGITPFFPHALPPGTTQNIAMIVGIKNPNEVLVTVKDAITGLPVSDAHVGLDTESKTTGIGFLRQTDWSGGPTQVDFIDPTKFFIQDGNIEVNKPAGDMKLNEITPGIYATNGNLESSTFDTGSDAVFKTITWTPGTQPPDTGAGSAKLQIATATTSTPTSWNYLGPDGTTATFYTSATPNIHPNHSGDRYLRYKTFLSTASTSFTPTVSDVAFTFTADCAPSGQVSFGGLTFMTYTLNVSKAGYQNFSENVTITSPWQEHEVIFTPE